MWLKGILFALFLISLVLIKFVQCTKNEPEGKDPFLWSTCIKDTPWVKGSGAPLKSWIKSLTPYYPANADLETKSPLKSGSLAHMFGLSNGEGDEIDYVKSTMLNMSWKKFGLKPYDGWLYGPSDKLDSFSGTDIAHIYNDFSTVIYGNFSKGVLEAGQERRIKGYRCKSGFMQLQFTRILHPENVYKFEDGNSTFWTSQPLLRDPFEKRMVYVKNSTIPGMSCSQGLFAKRNFPGNVVIALYGGLKISSSTVIPQHYSMELKEDIHKNWLSFNETTMLDIPPEMDSLHKYRATLGHKLNHHFFHHKAAFCDIKHPRFGEIGCIRSTDTILKDEEIFIHYNYDLGNNEIPEWYKDLAKMNGLL